jgi:WD40 repeat protein
MRMLSGYAACTLVWGLGIWPLASFSQEPSKDLVPPWAASVVNIRTLAFTSDGRLLAAGAGEIEEKGQVTVWDVKTRQLRFKHKLAKGVPVVAFSRDNKTLAVCSFTEHCYLLDADTGKVQRKLPGHGAAARSIAFAADGQTLAVGSYDHSIRLWDYSAGKLLHTWKGHTDWVYYLAYSPDGTMLASSSLDESVRLWEASSGKLLRTWRGYRGVLRCLAFESHGQWLATCCWDGTLKLRDLHSDKVLANLGNGATGVDWATIHPSGNTLAAGRMGRVVPILNVPKFGDATAEQQKQIQQWIAQWDDDRVEIRDQAGRELQKFGWTVEPLLAKAQQESRSAEIRIRARLARSALRDPQPVARLEGHRDDVLWGAYSPDGQLLATAGKDGVVLLWDTATYKMTACLTWP